MAMAATVNAFQSDELINDKETLELKSHLMNKLKKNSLLNSVSRAASFISGLMLTTGMALLATSLKSGMDAGGGANIMTAVAGNTVGLAFLAVGAIATSVSIGSDYVASRIFQGSSFDNLEINARSTAHHLVQELKENNLCLTEHEQNTRADGKAWADVIRQQNQPNFRRS